MGMVLVEKHGVVCVEEVVPIGNAAKAGVQPGDVLEECSAVLLKAGTEGAFEREGHGGRPFDNFDRVMLKCESLDTVMNALASNNERWGFKTIDLIIRRP